MVSGDDDGIGAIIGARQLYKLYRLGRQRQSRREDGVLGGVDLYAYQAHNGWRG